MREPCVAGLRKILRSGEGKPEMHKMGTGFERDGNGGRASLLRVTSGVRIPLPLRLLALRRGDPVPPARSPRTVRGGTRQPQRKIGERAVGRPAASTVYEPGAISARAE